VGLVQRDATSLVDRSGHIMLAVRGFSYDLIYLKGSGPNVGGWHWKKGNLTLCFHSLDWLSAERDEKPNADTDLIWVAYRGVVWCGLYDRDDDSITFLL